MEFLKIDKDEIIYPYSIEQLKSENPYTSFPQNITDETLLEYNIHQVISVSKGSDYTKNYTEITPVLISGVYYQNWNITDASSEEIEQKKNNQWGQVRSIRNQYLKDSDFTMLEDFPQRGIKLQEWKTYRQALRDVTLQLDPFNIVWPIKPV
jgi:hypothetical protein